MKRDKLPATTHEETPMPASPQDSPVGTAVGSSERSYELPPRGDNPSTERQGTTPGSFALKGRVGTPWTYSSPDTPGMPPPSPRTAWDFLPGGWLRTAGESAQAPDGFSPVTQLESARLGIVTPEMKRVALREPHLTPGQIRAEVAAGRMIVPANKVHLKYKLEPMA